MAKAKIEKAEPSFEESLAELELVVKELETGQLGLNQSLTRYEQGIKLLKRCHEALQQAEQKIRVVTRLDEQGQPVCEPFVEEAGASLEQKQQTRSRRRTDTPQTSESGDEDDMDIQRGLF